MNIANKRRFSIFISSTYQDLLQERQALFNVALENCFIPIGMEQFHATPASQWDVITKMIDESDFYLLVIGGRYGCIDNSEGIGYTEKEYNYAKYKGLPILVLIKQSSAITEDMKDMGESRYEKIKMLDDFRERVKNDGNTVDYFDDLNSLKYKASIALKNAVEYADKDAGWIRYKDTLGSINGDEIPSIWKGKLEYKYEKMRFIDNGVIRDVLFNLDQEEADSLFNLSRFVVNICGDDVPYIVGPIIMDPSHINIYQSHGVTYDALVQLDAKGIIRLGQTSRGSAFGVVVEDRYRKKITIKYYNDELVINSDVLKVPSGIVMFTKEGREIYKAICNEKIDGFWEQVVVPCLKADIQNKYL